MNNTSKPIEGYRFREANNDDVPDIQKVVFGVLTEYGLPLSEDDTDADIADLQKYYWDNNGYFGAIVHNGKTVGSYGLMNLGGGVCEIRKMYLLKAHRGKGLGKKALLLLLGKAKEMGYHTATLETAQVLKEAILLYKKMGFEEDKRADRVAARCDMVMKKSL